jgi:hypothetical protein
MKRLCRSVAVLELINNLTLGQARQVLASGRHQHRASGQNTISIAMGIEYKAFRASTVH